MGFLIVMLTVCGIIFAVTFVERLPSNATALDALYDSWTRLLEYIPLFLPLAVFMGTLVAFYNLTRSSESIIISSAGISPYKMSKSFILGACIIGVITTTIVNPYTVKSNIKDINSDNLTMIDNAIWLRESTENGFLTINAKNMSMKNTNMILKDVNLFIQDDKFKLITSIASDTATLSDGQIDIETGEVVDSNGIYQKKDITINTKLSTRTVLDRYLKPNQISFWKLPGFIKKMHSIGVVTTGHNVQFWTLLFLPLTLISMTILGIAFSQTRQRRNFSFGVKFSFGILTCFILYFVVNLFTTLGTIGSLPPLLSVVAPQIIIIAASGIFITKFDTI